MSDKINFIVDKQNPVFGRVFELPALLPYDNKLTISVMDHDYLSVDDVIGMYIAYNRYSNFFIQYVCARRSKKNSFHALML